MTERSFETSAPPLVRVRNGAGDVVVETVDGAHAEVRLVALRDDEATREAIAAAEVELRDGVLTVAVERRRTRILGRDPEVGVRVRCPHGSAADIRVASAGVACAGRLRAVAAVSASGDVAVEDCGGDLDVETASGDVTVRSVAGSAVVASASGDVRLDAVRGPVTVDTASGDVSVGDVHGSLRVHTVSGDQHVGSCGGGDIVLQSVSGDVDVGVRRGTRLYVEANSVSGDLVSELELDAAPPPGDAPVVALRAHTISGDLRVARAAYAESSSASSAPA